MTGFFNGIANLWGDVSDSLDSFGGDGPAQDQATTPGGMPGGWLILGALVIGGIISRIK